MTKTRTLRDVAVARVRAKVDLAEVVAAEGIKLKPAGGGQLKGLCPFHEERTPSFMVNRAKGVYFCYGCGAGGDAITFVMTQRHLSFVEAVQLLAGRLGMKVGSAKVVHALEAPRAAPEYDYQDVSIGVDFAEQVCPQHAAAALAELAARILRDDYDGPWGAAWAVPDDEPPWGTQSPDHEQPF